MYTVEFQASIENGVVHIPEQYKEIQNTTKATFIVMYNNTKVEKKQNSISDELDELFANSNNKVEATMDLVSNTDEMVTDGIL
jgi:hypothetical protein